jgi:hypothetical protein
VFVSEEAAQRTLSCINAAHRTVERQRSETIPEWAYRDVLYMLIDYSERAHALLCRPLSTHERNELYRVFLRIGEGLSISQLPEAYGEWRHDRRLHLVRDLTYSRHTAQLFRQYRVHLGAWRYYLLLQIQALLVPDEVRRLLRLNSNNLISGLAHTYGILTSFNLRSVVHSLLIPPRYWAEVRQFDRGASTK